jgi:hypothetical protein
MSGGACTWSDPRDERMCLLTDRDEIIGPLTTAQLDDLQAEYDSTDELPG